MKRRPRPIQCVWDGEHFVPQARFVKLCNEEFVVGEDYPLMVVENQSASWRGYYFAALKEGFDNLSEENTKHFPSVEHLRKWALVQCGFCTGTDTVLDSNKDARLFAAAIRKRDEYAVIRVQGNVVQVFDAESQSPTRMKKERFEESVRAVLELVASMARTTASQLKKEGRHNGR